MIWLALALGVSACTGSIGDPGNTSGSGTGRVDMGAVSTLGKLSFALEIAPGVIVDQVSTWAEIAPPEAYVLAPGTVWSVTTGALDKTTGAEGSVQLQVLTTKPEPLSGRSCTPMTR